ncbi:MAG: hotdog fold thioesterase [Gammaproteobacteria bacterium]|nr:MAG: hotdog fold thioesterase [Gammaproteobacteria bacterium]
MTSIWHRKPTLDELNQRGQKTAVEHLAIEITDIGDDYLTGTMPVDHRTTQPLGLLHGGASVLLAESLGSIAANYCVNPDKAYCVGMEINANHLRSVKGGIVTGIARPVHLGRTTQVWEIRIHNQVNKPVCISRLTIAVVQKHQG